MVKAFLFSNGSPTGFKFEPDLAGQNDCTANQLERSNGVLCREAEALFEVAHGQTFQFRQKDLAR